MVVCFRFNCDIFIFDDSIDIKIAARGKYRTRLLLKVRTLDLGPIFVNIVFILINLNQDLFSFLQIQFLIIKGRMLNTFHVNVTLQCFNMRIEAGRNIRVPFAPWDPLFLHLLKVMLSVSKALLSSIFLGNSHSLHLEFIQIGLSELHQNFSIMSSWV